MSELAQKRCEPCQGGVPPLAEDKQRLFLAELDQWRIVENHHLSKEFSFPDFASALSFVNKIAEVAETEAHHPDIYLAWGKVRIDIWTHKIDNLTEADFVLAAKLDQIG